MKYCLFIVALIFFSSSGAQAEISLDLGGVNGGALKLGDGNLVCDQPSQNGYIEWDPAQSCMRVCARSTWRCVIFTQCDDVLPDTFSFTDVTNASVSTTTTSNIVQINGISGCEVAVSLTSDFTSDQFRICSDAACSTVVRDWSSASAPLSNGQYLQIRVTTRAQPGFIHPIDVNVGTEISTWTVTNAGSCSDPTPAIGTMCADGTVYVGLSPDGNTKMYTMICDYGKYWMNSTCNGGRTLMRWSTGQTALQGYTSTITGESNTAGLAAITTGDGPFQAALICQDLVYGGHTDWYLPATNEILLMNGGCGTLPDFGCDSVEMWTSTEASATQSRRLRRGVGMANNSKFSPQGIRCVRKD